MSFAELDGDIRDKSFPAQTGRLMVDVDTSFIKQSSTLQSERGKLIFIVRANLMIQRNVLNGGGDTLCLCRELRAPLSVSS